MHRRNTLKIITEEKKFMIRSMHIFLSGILKCPCCGKGMYGKLQKQGGKIRKPKYYYYCKNTVNATGHKCTFRCNIRQSQN